MSRWLRAMVLLLAGGCASAASPGPDTVAPAAPPARSSGVRVEVDAPAVASYKLDVFGLAGAPVTLRVTNVGPVAVPVDDLTVAFTASREGVAYPCRPSGNMPTGREPAVLQPHQSFVYRRTLDCSLPLPGTYAFAAYAAFGRAPRLGAPADAVGTFTVRLRGAGMGVPQPDPELNGLFAGVSGNPFERPLSPEEWAKANYGVVVALINGSRHPIDGVRARVVFRVYHVGSTVACLESPTRLDVPPVLAPGAMYTQRVPVTCVMNTPGQYDVVGYLELGDADPTPMELDRFRVTVTDDPLLFAPPLQPHLPPKANKETPP